MKLLIIILWIMSFSAVGFTDEVTTTLDRCTILSPDKSEFPENSIAINFTMPEILDGKEIIFAVIEFEVSIEAPPNSDLFEIRLFPLLGNRNIEIIDISFETDSLSIGAYTVNLNEQQDYHIEITEYVKDVVDGERANYGFIAHAEILGNDIIRLASNVGTEIKNAASIRIIYK